MEAQRDWNAGDFASAVQVRVHGNEAPHCASELEDLPQTKEIE